LPPGSSVLDLGGGTGSLIDLLAEFYPHLSYTLVDPNPAALARASEKLAKSHPNLSLELVLESIQPESAAPLAGGSFSLAISTISLHDIVRPAAIDDLDGRADHRRRHVALLRRVLDSLAPGGHFIYADAMHPGFRVTEHLDTLREAGFVDVDAADVRGRHLVCGGLRA
jgi:SAM-dependent methyltransferase